MGELPRQDNSGLPIWEGQVNEPKTRRSKTPVPVILALARILDAYRLQRLTSGPMFKLELRTRER
jgi:hypothetical protein